MKIIDIKTYSLPAHLKNQFIVKVETDEGISGWGEGGLSTRDLAMKGAVQHYREWLIGRDPLRMGALWQEMYRSQYFEGGRVLLAAQSALDIALYDIAGKALGVPCYQLMGGRHRDYVDTFATTGGASTEELIANVTRFLEAGWSVVRLFHAGLGGRDANEFEPRISIGRTAPMVTALREAVGPEPVLGVEYHHRLSVAEAASFCQRMPRGTIDFLEEPIRDECPEAYATLRSMVDVPFAIGEEFSSKWQFLPYIERGLTNFCRVDICNVGGFTESLKVAGWCEAHYINLMPHNPLGPINTAAILHLAAAVPNFAWMEVFVPRLAGSFRSRESERLDEQVFLKRPELEGARFPVPTDPGLGVEVDEEALAAIPFQMAEFPHQHKRDGSHTNW